MKLYVGDVGTLIKLDTGNDLTNATLQKIKYKKPNDTTGEWEAEIEDPPTAGIIKYKVTAGVFDVSGIWKLQAYVEFDADHWLGETVTMKVSPEWV